MFIDCYPEAAAARSEWAALLHVTGGRLMLWKPKSDLTWQEICKLTLGKTHPLGTVSSMVASSDAVESALRSLHNLNVLRVDSCLLEDVFLLRKLLCVCLMHKSPVQFVESKDSG